MSILASLHESAAPPVAVEITSARVSAASLEWRGGRPVVAAHASEPLPEGALIPSLTAANAIDRAAVTDALTRLLEKMGRPRRIGLILPDVVGKVSLVRFERVPSKAQDLDQLVRWQVRKSAPFAIEEAQVSYVPGLSAADGHEFVVTLARRGVIEEYEQLCAAAGAHAGIVDLTTLNVINAVLAGGGAPSTSGASSTADWLLVNVAGDYTSIALLRGPSLIFFRNRSAETDGTLADLVHQSAMYYEDRLKGSGFARVLVSGAAAAIGARPSSGIDELRRSLEERLKTAVETVDPRSAAALTDRISAPPAVLDTLTPLVGLLLRDRAEAIA
jgi:Tfp pilus assembly PilM family ATPase